MPASGRSAIAVIMRAFRVFYPGTVLATNGATSVDMPHTRSRVGGVLGAGGEGPQRTFLLASARQPGSQRADRWRCLFSGATKARSRASVSHSSLPSGLENCVRSRLLPAAHPQRCPRGSERRKRRSRCAQVVAVGVGTGVPSCEKASMTCSCNAQRGEKGIGVTVREMCPLARVAVIASGLREWPES